MPVSLQLMSLAPGAVNKVTLASLGSPTLIKQGDNYFIYGNSSGNQWELTALTDDTFLAEVKDLEFPTTPQKIIGFDVNHPIYKHIESKGAKTLIIKPHMLHKGSDYEMVNISHHRSQAAKEIQSKCRINITKNDLKDNPELAQQKVTELQNKMQLNKRKVKEPAGELATRFNQDLKTKINMGRYDLINYNHPDFTRYIFGALRAGVITMNEMMSVKLMYDSLFFFNQGEMPPSPNAQFSRYKLSDASGPYRPTSITYWRSTEQKALEEKLSQPEEDEKHHYYTINMNHRQVVLYIYHLLNQKHNPSCLNEQVLIYLNTKKTLTDPIKEIMKKLSTSESLTADERNLLKDFIVLNEPQEAKFINPTIVQTLSESELAESSNIRFLVAIVAVNTQIPTLCKSPQYDKDNPNAPILSFILPTIDTLNTLQIIAHGAEATLVTATVGAETPIMIRAYDEVPARKVGLPAKKDDIYDLLQSNYPVTSRLERSSRPVEYIHPDIDKTENPHDYRNCRDFLLTWHDIFHGWRNGSLFKDIFRNLRTLHDQKAGLAVKMTGMSPALWKLTDLDSSTGQNLRTVHENTPAAYLLQQYYLAQYFIFGLDLAKINFDTMSDDNYLFLYDCIKSPDKWMTLDGKHIPITEETLKQWIELFPGRVIGSERTCEQLTNILNALVNTKKIMDENPDAHILDVILKDLLIPSETGDDALLAQLHAIDYKNIFYWSMNTGIYFNTSMRKMFAAGIKPALRQNTPQHLREALKIINTTIGLDDLIKLGITDERIKVFLKSNHMLNAKQLIMLYTSIKDPVLKSDLLKDDGAKKAIDNILYDMYVKHYPTPIPSELFDSLKDHISEITADPNKKINLLEKLLFLALERKNEALVIELLDNIEITSLDCKSQLIPIESFISHALINSSASCFDLLLDKYSSEELTKVFSQETLPNLVLNNFGIKTFVKLINKLDIVVAQKAILNIQYLTIVNNYDSLMNCTIQINEVKDLKIKSLFWFKILDYTPTKKYGDQMIANIIDTVKPLSDLYNMKSTINNEEAPLLYFAAFKSQTWFNAILDKYDTEELTKILNQLIPDIDQPSLPVLIFKFLEATDFIRLINKLHKNDANDIIDKMSARFDSSKCISFMNQINKVEDPDVKKNLLITVFASIFNNYANDQSIIKSIDSMEKKLIQEHVLSLNGYPVPLLYRSAIQSPLIFNAILNTYDPDELNAILNLPIPNLFTGINLPTLPLLVGFYLGAESYFKLINKLDKDVAKNTLQNMVVGTIGKLKISLEDLFANINTIEDPDLRDVGLLQLLKLAASAEKEDGIAQIIEQCSLEQLARMNVSIINCFKIFANNKWEIAVNAILDKCTIDDLEKILADSSVKDQLLPILGVQTFIKFINKLPEESAIEAVQNAQDYDIEQLDIVNLDEITNEKVKEKFKETFGLGGNPDEVSKISALTAESGLGLFPQQHTASSEEEGTKKDVPSPKT